jgi:titin
LITAIDVPGTPTNLSASSGSVNSVRVTFTAPVSNGGGAITDYDVEYSTDPNFEAGTGTFFEGATASTSTTIDVTDLTGGLTYYFRVRAQNAAGSGVWTYISNGAIASSTPPGAPTNVSASRLSSGTVRVLFTAPSDTGNSAISDYDIEFSTDPQFQAGAGIFVEAGTTTNSYVDVTGLTNGITYYFRVRAQNGAGFGPWSVLSNGAAAYTVPDAPFSLVGRQRPGNSLYMQWQAGANGGSAITDYRVGFGSSSTAPSTIFADGVSVDLYATITGLVNKGGYYLFVCALNAAGCSDWTSYGLITAIDVPGTPTNISAAFQAPGVVRVTFTAPVSNGGGAITDYDVEYSTDPNFEAGTGTFFEGATASTSTTIDVTGLTLGVVYYFRVRAQNAAGFAPWSYITNGDHG